VSWAEANPQTLFVIDEAYVAFAPEAETAVSHHLPNLLILRSMTKDYALAGLRLGYAVCDPDVIANMQKVKPPWSVNALAQSAGEAALADQAYLQTCMTRLQTDKVKLITDLTDLGYQPQPSATHYFLLNVGNGAVFRARLLQKGVLVRDCASFGLPEYVRIATRSEEDNGRLLAALAKKS
jgi:histidinol-phosphate/aromatic aminotransferase/cobyric acid decarboxylase-like protein